MIDCLADLFHTLVADSFLGNSYWKVGLVQDQGFGLAFYYHIPIWIAIGTKDANLCIEDPRHSNIYSLSKGNILLPIDKRHTS